MELGWNSQFKERLPRLLYRLIYIAAFIFCVFKVWDYRHLNFGFTALPRFGSEFHQQSLADLKQAAPYRHEGKGYDGQFYAQLALRPSANGEDIEQALDNYGYRARRILFSWTAWCLGLGNPDWALQAYGWQNALFWLATGLILLRWLPPNNWQNTLRFLCCFFAAGLIGSFEKALLDGPSLFLIALAALLIESRRSWLGAGVLAVSGLGKETNLLGLGALWESDGARDRQSMLKALQAAVAVLPCILWGAYIMIGAGDGPQSILAGTGVLHLPLVGFFSTALEMLKKAGETGFPAEFYIGSIALASFLIQGLYLAVRPKPNNVWWRIGIVYTVLMLFLGPKVWENVEAAPRVLLPMTIAFNILFSRRAWLLPALLFANWLTFIGLGSFQPQHIEERFDHITRSELAYDAEANRYETLDFGNGWSVAEGSVRRFWRWSSGDGEIAFRIPGDQKVRGILEFIPRTISPREIILEVNGAESWRMQSGGGYGSIQSIPIALNPGENRLRIHSPQPSERFGQDPRELSFSIYEYDLLLSAALEE